MASQRKVETLQQADDEARQAVKSIIRTVRAGALALLDPDGGAPTVSRAGLATDIDGCPIFPMSDLSGRPQMADRDGRASLLVGDPGKGDPLAHPRATLDGRIVRLQGDDQARARGRYLARHPKAELYIDFADFSLWRFEIEKGQYNGGFGKAYDMTAKDLTTSGVDLAAWGAREAGAREHMNDDHDDAVALYATSFLGAPEGAWHLAGIDPEGIDLTLKDDHRRLWFDNPLNAPDEMHHALVLLVKRARAKLALT
ncbi:MAG: DUF2470 domain-containing protein [Pseudomonadota bacterium]